jgi:hypothetical protein
MLTTKKKNNEKFWGKKKHKSTKRACMLITNLNAQESCKTRTKQNKN